MIRFSTLLMISCLMIGKVNAQLHPYLQTPTPTSIYISWYSTDTSFSKVRFGLSQLALSQVITGSFQNISGKIWHTVKLTGLNPGTTYYYRCISGQDSSGVFPFRSQPTAGTQGLHLVVVFIGDSRGDSTTGHTRLGLVCAGIKAKLTEKYGNQWYNNVNLLINSGDITHNGLIVEKFNNEYLIPLDTLCSSLPVMVAAGNHEHDAAVHYDHMKYEDFTDSLVRLTPYNERFYSFQIVNCQFVIINTNENIIDLPQQETWLQKVLTESNSNPATDMVFVFGHHPWHSEVSTLSNREEMASIYFNEFSNFYKVVQYGYGHSHDFEIGAFQMTQPQTDNVHDLRLVLSGGGGAEINSFDSLSKDYQEINETITDYSYVIMDIDVDNKSYSAEAYTIGRTGHPIANKLFEKWHFRMNQAPPSKPVANSVSGLQPVILSASAMAGLDSCMSSQFQVTSVPGNYSTPVIDTIRDWQNIYGNSGIPDYTPINLNAGINLSSLTVPSGKLNTGINYGFRVRYRDHNLKWSPWSDEKTFIIVGMENLRSDIPGIVTLYQNYPNPFFSSSTISYRINSGTFVELRIYDVFGKEIKTLVDKYQQAGDYQVDFQAGQTIPEGVYYVKILVEGGTASKTMIITQ